MRPGRRCGALGFRQRARVPARRPAVTPGTGEEVPSVVHRAAVRHRVARVGTCIAHHGAALFRARITGRARGAVGVGAAAARERSRADAATHRAERVARAADRARDTTAAVAIAELCRTAAARARVVALEERGRDSPGRRALHVVEDAVVVAVVVVPVLAAVRVSIGVDASADPFGDVRVPVAIGVGADEGVLHHQHRERLRQAIGRARRQHDGRRRKFEREELIAGARRGRHSVEQITVDSDDRAGEHGRRRGRDACQPSKRASRDKIANVRHSTDRSARRSTDGRLSVVCAADVEDLRAERAPSELKVRALAAAVLLRDDRRGDRRALVALWTRAGHVAPRELGRKRPPDREHFVALLSDAPPHRELSRARHDRLVAIPHHQRVPKIREHFTGRSSGRHRQRVAALADRNRQRRQRPRAASDRVLHEQRDVGANRRAAAVG
jgi:hypothetical protein